MIRVGGGFSMQKIYDAFHREMSINDEVRFSIGRDTYTGIINFIAPNGLLRINLLVGEYRRMPNKVIKVVR